MEIGIAQFRNHGIVKIDEQTIYFNLINFAPFAVHGIHIHEYGDDRKGCESLGAHYNPTNELHGNHAGDIIFNLVADSRGHFTYKTRHNLFLDDLFGRSIVIHENEDDMGVVGSKYFQYPSYLRNESERTGNAGKRIDYALIVRALND